MWYILVGIDAYKADFLRKLSESYDLYLLNNNNPISIPRSRKIFADAGMPLDKTFRKYFLSYEMKVLKPSRTFYQDVKSQIGLPAGEMIIVFKHNR